MNNSVNLRVSTVNRGGRWQGAIRRGRVIEWECSHEHPTRDVGPYAAYVCAAKELDRRRVFAAQVSK